MRLTAWKGPSLLNPTCVRLIRSWPKDAPIRPFRRCVLTILAAWGCWIGLAIPCEAQVADPETLSANLNRVSGPGLQSAPPSKTPTASAVRQFSATAGPILARHCTSCHSGTDAESGLRLDRRASVLSGGDSGQAAVVPGQPEQSELIRRVTATDDSRMPPEGPRLSSDERQQLIAWIRGGAVMPETFQLSAEATGHWSFQPIRAQIRLPITSEWARNPIDTLVEAELRRIGLEPQQPAASVTLIRRLFLDVLGLPPSPEDVQRFVNDRSPQAYERLVDHVLASPQYGERWARHWLDVARFGETHGFETNRERVNAWPYRDYVIRALNEDLPYDDFVRQQLAGDQFEADVATGFLVAGPHDLVKSPDISLTLKQRQDELDDMVNTTGSVFLGLTIGCARCHDHKFDPISQRDYYAWQAIFAGVHHDERRLPPYPGASRRLRELQQLIDRSERRQLIDGARLARIPGVQWAPLSPLRNIEWIEPVRTGRLRFRILATNSSQPCLDELEVWSGSENVALATSGTRASSSSDLPGYEIHQLKHIHDGRYGNSHSWISNEPGGGWVELRFPQPVRIDRIEWARDREGKYSDRLPTRYVIEVEREDGSWQTVATEQKHAGHSAGTNGSPGFALENLPPAEDAAWERSLRQLASWRLEAQQLELGRMAYIGRFERPPETHRLHRGEPLQPREVVPPETLTAFGQLPLHGAATERERRAALADWITNPANPLTSRVIVNRLWQHHFGRGLVRTSSDFGRNGAVPSHPELLDWLAAELIRRDWSLKAIHRLILTSATYRQSAEWHPRGIRADAACVKLWRFPSRRLEAEAIRDCMVAVSGDLNLRMGGPGFSGFEVELENVRHYFPKQSYGWEDWRRMVYMTKVRQEHDSVFGVFDCPDGSQTVPQRSRSITPLQALNLFNSQFTIQQAEHFAVRVATEAGADREEQIRRAFLLALSRQPDEVEQAAAWELIDRHGMPALCRALLNSTEFVRLP